MSLLYEMGDVFRGSFRMPVSLLGCCSSAITSSLCGVSKWLPTQKGQGYDCVGKERRKGKRHISLELVWVS